MAAYYNENDPKTAAWLRELIKAGLIADGEVDDRSIELVRPEDVRGFVQCHFFAGIGGWSYALRLAGWRDDRHVWTGSCPCQSVSSAARGRLVAQDLWPAWAPLIAQCAPRTIFGEQVVNERWADTLVFDLEYLGYEVGAAVVPACAVGFDHARERFYFVGHADGYSQSGMSVDEKVAGVSRYRSDATGMVSANGVSARVDLMRGFGNAIVPQVAAEVIGAYMEIAEEAALKGQHESSSL
jgi:DNA (cytosine-5)-methyltransferase 1